MFHRIVFLFHLHIWYAMTFIEYLSTWPQSSNRNVKSFEFVHCKNACFIFQHYVRNIVLRFSISILSSSIESGWLFSVARETAFQRSKNKNRCSHKCFFFALLGFYSLLHVDSHCSNESAYYMLESNMEFCFHSNRWIELRKNPRFPSYIQWSTWTKFNAISSC